MILLDTNVLVYALDEESPHHHPSRAIVEGALKRQLPGVLLPQILLEFYAVITHPRRVRRPLDSKQAWHEVEQLRLGLPVLEAGVKALERLIGEDVRGADIFDAYLAAQMRTLGIGVICTYNIKDFERFTNLLAKRPEELLPAGS